MAAEPATFIIPMQVTLVTAAVAVFVNMWLARRIGRLRHQYKVSVGDGGHDLLLRRMRAQANFIEHAPFFLILLAGIELSGARQLPLAALAVIFIAARIAHAYGMDGGSLQNWRRIGMVGSCIAIVALAVWALGDALVLQFA